MNSFDNNRSMTPIDSLCQKSSERYLPNFKKKVLNSLKDPDKDNGDNSCNSKTVSLVEASKKFQVHPTTISDWIQEEKRQDELRLIADKNLAFNKETDTLTNQQETINESQNAAEIEFLNWLKSMRMSSNSLSLEQIDVVNKIDFIIQKHNPNQSSSSFGSPYWIFELGKKIQLCLAEKEEGEESNEKSLKVKESEKIAKRTKYSTQFKLEVAEYGKKYGQRLSSRLFAISQRRVFDWIHSYESLVKETSKIEDNESRKRNLKSSNEDYAPKTPREAISTRSSKQVADFDVETAVFDWVEEQLPSKPSSSQIRNKAIQLYREKGIEKIQCSYGWYRRWCERFKKLSHQHEEEDNPIITWLLTQYDNNVPVSYTDLQNYSRQELKEKKPDFKASAGWATRFFKRHHLLINWEGFYDSDFPRNLNANVQDFLSYQNFDKNGTLDRIGAVDEIPLSFAIPTLTQCQSDSQDPPEKISRMRKITIKNCDATLILGILANGDLLTPMLIVKAEGSKNLNQLFIKNDNPVVVYYAKTTEPTISCLEKWIELIWVKSLGPGESFLFMDSYDLHHMLSEKCEKFDIEQRVFPPGCSAKLQPLNVFIRRAFLKLVEEKWIAHLDGNKDDNRMKLPTTNDLVDWVYLTYLELNKEKTKVKESFNQVKIIPV